MDAVVLDVERLGPTAPPGGQRASRSEQPAVSLEPLSPPHAEVTPRTPADISIAVTSKDVACRPHCDGHMTSDVCLTSVFSGSSHQALVTSSAPTRCLLSPSSVRWSCQTYRCPSTCTRTSPEACCHGYDPPPTCQVRVQSQEP